MNPIKKNLIGSENKKKKKPNDNKLIGELQDKFFLNRNNEKIKLELWNSIKACARRMINSERIKKGFFLSAEDMDSKANECVVYIFTQYGTRPDFKMKAPAGYIYLRVLAALYRHKKIEEYLTYTDKDL